MAVLKIVEVGDPLLRKVSRPVEEITPRVLTLLDDMVETMHKHDGCGLAAVQVGVLRRIVVIETVPGEIHELINPRIVCRNPTMFCLPQTLLFLTPLLSCHTLKYQH